MAAKGIFETDLAALNAKAAHQLASLSGAVHDLVRFGPNAMHEGLTLLARCEERLRRLAARERATQGITTERR